MIINAFVVIKDCRNIIEVVLHLVMIVACAPFYPTTIQYGAVLSSNTRWWRMISAR